MCPREIRRNNCPGVLWLPAQLGAAPARSSPCPVAPTCAGFGSGRGLQAGLLLAAAGAEILLFVNIWDSVLFWWVAVSQVEVFGMKTNPLWSSERLLLAAVLGVSVWHARGGRRWVGRGLGGLLCPWAGGALPREPPCRCPYMQCKADPI